MVDKHIFHHVAYDHCFKNEEVSCLGYILAKRFDVGNDNININIVCPSSSLALLPLP